MKDSDGYWVFTRSLALARRVLTFLQRRGSETVTQPGSRGQEMAEEETDVGLSPRQRGLCALGFLGVTGFQGLCQVCSGFPGCAFQGSHPQGWEVAWDRCCSQRQSSRWALKKIEIRVT